jgi:hypothetical protein
LLSVAMCSLYPYISVAHVYLFLLLSCRVCSYNIVSSVQLL